MFGVFSVPFVGFLRFLPKLVNHNSKIGKKNLIPGYINVNQSDKQITPSIKQELLDPYILKMSNF